MAKVYLRGKIYYGDYWQNGKRIRKPLSENKRTAEEMLGDILAAKRAMRVGLMPRNISWSGFKERYMKHCRSEKDPHTAYMDGLAFRMLEDVLPIRSLNDLTPEFLERVIMRWKEKGKGQAAIARAVRSIKAAMHKAEDWGFIGMQNWRKVKAKEPGGRLHYYTLQEWEGLVKLATGPWRTAIWLMGRAGLRAGEVMNLEWPDIDFERRTIWVHAKEGWKPKGWTEENNKSRYIDMPDDLQAYLEGLPNKQGLVLGPKSMNYSTFLNHIKMLARNAGLSGTPHTFRHTYASHLISHGCSLEEVGALLGHSDPDMTKIYAHLMPHARRKAVDRLPKIVSSL